jgi:hypothetical protein
MIKTIEEIDDEFCNERKLSKQSIKDLAWHVENDQEPGLAIALVADTYTMELIPSIAKHLDSKDSFVREITVGCILGQLHVAEYAARALNMALDDSKSGPRALATSNLGSVLNRVTPNLKKKIADYLYEVVTNPRHKYHDRYKEYAYQSISQAMGIPVTQWHAVEETKILDWIRNFRIKYSNAVDDNSNKPHNSITLVKAIQEMYNTLNHRGKLSKQAIKDLEDYIENGQDPHLAIAVAEEVVLIELAPLIAKHLDNEGYVIRTIAVRCLIGTFHMAKYAKKAFNIAKADPHEAPRMMAMSKLGEVINQVDANLKKEIAYYLYDIMFSDDYSNGERGFAIDSIFTALKIPSSRWGSIIQSSEIDDLIEKFKNKYEVKYGSKK